MRYCRREYDQMKFKEVPRSESQRNLFWRVFLLFLRISTPAETKTESFSPEIYQKIVIDSGISQ